MRKKHAADGNVTFTFGWLRSAYVKVCEKNIKKQENQMFAC